VPFDTPVNATDASLERAVHDASIPVVAVFWSPENPSRGKLHAVLQEAAEAYAGDLLVLKVQMGDAPEARTRYGVDASPQFLFFRDGKLVARAKGTPSLKALRPWVEYALGRGPKPTLTNPRQRKRQTTDGRPVQVTDATFDRVVLNADVPVLVDFWAAWCGPCHTVAPVIEDLARDFAGRAVVTKLDVDANQATARRFHVMSVPTLVFFQGGREVDRVTGAQPRHVLQQRLEALVGGA
jgi:thioredoxin 1